MQFFKKDPSSAIAGSVSDRPRSPLLMRGHFVSDYGVEFRMFSHYSACSSLFKVIKVITDGVLYCWLCQGETKRSVISTRRAKDIEAALLRRDFSHIGKCTALAGSGRTVVESGG